jgi:uncharacterized membrane protein
MNKTAGAVLAGAVFAVLLAAPAEAGLTLCNRTSYILYAAVATATRADVAVAGWTRLLPGACADAIRGDLNAAGYLVYAKTSRAHSGPSRAWTGAVNACVREGSFTLHMAPGARCPVDAYEAGFTTIATAGRRGWTTTLHETPALADMAAAERAGLKRLLADTGARPLGNDRQIDAALAALRHRRHLAANAPTAALFDALEAEAMTSAVPTGYTLCNDTGDTVFAAIGLQYGTAFVSRGWWTLGAHSCSPLLTEAVAGRKIWLRVERHGGPPLVQGPMRFCTTNIEFDIQGRARCAVRGLAEAGFLQTHGGLATGFVAHVSASGLTRR